MVATVEVHRFKNSYVVFWGNEVSEDCNVIPFETATLPCERPADTLLKQIVERAHALQAVLAHAAADARSNQTFGQFAKTLLWERRQRGSVLAPELTGDPAWDMVLDLFVAEQARKQVAVTSLCYGSGVPSSTALRWVAVLVERDMITRENDPSDGRRVNVSLTEQTRSSICAYLERVAARRGIVLTDRS
jgi:predicted transcriptional regulator